MPAEQTDTTQTPPDEITYTPTVWADGADGGTPINAANMNNMEEAIVALVERTTKQIVTSMIKDGAVTNLKLSPELQDLLSHTVKLTTFNLFNGNLPDGAQAGGRVADLSYFDNGDEYYLAVDTSRQVWIGVRYMSSTGSIIWSKL